jgi:hypothetical protein
MSPEGLRLTSMDEESLLAVPLALGVGSHIGLQMIRTLTHLPTQRRRPCACDPCVNIVYLNLVSLVLYLPVSYHSGMPDDSLSRATPPSSWWSTAAAWRVPRRLTGGLVGVSVPGWRSLPLACLRRRGHVCISQGCVAQEDRWSGGCPTPRRRVRRGRPTQGESDAEGHGPVVRRVGRVPVACG